jgi:hypothetical protein
VYQEVILDIKIWCSGKLQNTPFLMPFENIIKTGIPTADLLHEMAFMKHVTQSVNKYLNYNIGRL